MCAYLQLLAERRPSNKSAPNRATLFGAVTATLGEAFAGEIARVAIAGLTAGSNEGSIVKTKC